MRNFKPNHRIREDTGSNWGWIAGTLLAVLFIAAIAIPWEPGPVNLVSNNTNVSAPAN